MPRLPSLLVGALLAAAAAGPLAPCLRGAETPVAPAQATPAAAGLAALLALPSPTDERIGGSLVVVAPGQALTLQEAFPAPVAVGDAITVVAPGGGRRQAQVLRCGSATTAVLVTLDTTGLVPLTASDPVALGLGSGVWTVGNSTGSLEDDGTPAVSHGTVSGRYALPADGPAVRGRGGRILSQVNGAVIEIDAAVNDGNQGGAVLDESGHLVGLASMAESRERRLGTAVPIDRLFADVGLPPPAAATPAPPFIPPTGLALVTFDRPAGLGNPEAVPRPPRTADQVPPYERERLESWWDAYHHSQQVLWTDSPAPALVIDADKGYLLTAASHLHGDATTGRVAGPDGSSVAVKVLAVDAPLDLVLLVADHPLSLPAAVIAPVVPTLGSPVAVVARFTPPGQGLGFTRTAGTVSCVGRRLDRADEGFLQVDARADYASLGGALVDQHGRVIGMVVKAGPALPWLVNSGVTLAVDGATIARALPALLAGKGRDKLPALALGVVLEQRDGQVVLVGIQPGSGAEAAGLQTGDVLVAVDGRPAGSDQAVTRALLRHRAGDHARVELTRAGRPLAIEVELRELEQ